MENDGIRSGLAGPRHTSVPSWAHEPVPSAVGVRGGSHLLVGVGTEAAAVLARWEAELGGDDAAVRTLLASDADTAREWLTAALARARVGVRLWLAGPVGACLTLRAAALAAGLEDDELFVASVGQGPIELACVHCGVTAPVDAGIGATVDCPGCGRRLLVMEHVSRRLGSFLGLQADVGAGGG